MMEPRRFLFWWTRASIVLTVGILFVPAAFIVVRENGFNWRVVAALAIALTVTVVAASLTALILQRLWKRTGFFD